MLTAIWKLPWGAELLIQVVRCSLWVYRYMRVDVGVGVGVVEGVGVGVGVGEY